MTVTRRALAGAVLTSAVGLALAASLTNVSAAEISPQMQQKLNKMLEAHPGANADVIKGNMARVQKYHLAKCFGVNAVGKNDCASGAHSCAGQSTQARDPSAFVLLPRGDCQKLAGGSLKGPM